MPENICGGCCGRIARLMALVKSFERQAAASATTVRVSLTVLAALEV